MFFQRKELYLHIVVIKNELYYINPFLNLIGYGFYRVTYIEENDDNLKETIWINI